MSRENRNVKLGNVLRNARHKRGLTLREVEAKTGISNPYLSQLETGKIREPSPLKLYHLAKAYRMPFKDLLKIAYEPLKGCGL